MEDIFADETEDLTDSNIFSDGTQETEPSADTATETPAPSAVPVQPEQDSLGDEAGFSGDLSSPADTHVSEGVETVPASDTVEQIDYTELLQLQNQHLESLVMETKEMNERLADFNHAMPVMVCMLGFVAGVLLVQIFSSYLRV